jgi:hypothetical protein
LALNRPVELALALFVVLLWLFVTVADKKLERYFLPAFPIIDVFVAMGLFWLLDGMVRFRNGRIIRRWAVPVAGGVLLLGQGGLVLNHYPYYFTHYNPLVGGPSGAAHIITIEGWGEGLNEAASYLNQKRAAKSLHVVVEMWCSTFTPFFAGKANCLNSNAGGIMGADFMIYYYNVVQRNLEWAEQWRYFEAHQLPEHRINLHGLDYVLIYRNPIQHQVDREANSLPDLFTTFGYNLTGDGQLTLFWQNLGLGRRQVRVGLAPSNGIYAIDAPTASTIGERRWITCEPKPEFVDEVDTRGAIIESLCPLAITNLPPGLYDLQLGLSDGAATSPLSSSLLGVFLINRNQHFLLVKLGQTSAQSITSPRVDDFSN